MPTNLERLQQTYDNLVALREQVTRNPKPNYTVDGERYDWGDYLESLSKQIAAVKVEIDDAGDDGIVEEHTTAY